MYFNTKLSAADQANMCYNWIITTVWKQIYGRAVSEIFKRAGGLLVLSTCTLASFFFQKQGD